MGRKEQNEKRMNYFVSFKSLRYPSHSLQIGFPLYFGLPSLIFSVPGTILQIQHTAISDKRKDIINKNSQSMKKR